MNIGICGNEASIKKGIINSDNQNIGIVNFVSYTPESLILDVEEGFFNCSILFIDITLEEFAKEHDVHNITGIDIADKVNKRFPQCQIIYISDGKIYDERVYETTHVFLMLRDNIEKRMSKALSLAFEKMKNVMDKDVVEIISEGSKVFIHRDQITYIEREDRQIKVVTPNKVYPCYDSIKSILEKLDNRMTRIHGGGIVHLGYVKYFGKGKIELSYEGIEKVMPVGRSYQKSVKEAYYNYWKKISD